MFSCASSLKFSGEFSRIGTHCLCILFHCREKTACIHVILNRILLLKRPSLIAAQLLDVWDFICLHMRSTYQTSYVSTCHHMCVSSIKLPFRTRTFLEEGFRPCNPLLFKFVPWSRTKRSCGFVPEHASGPSIQVLPGCRVRHPEGKLESRSPWQDWV